MPTEHEIEKGLCEDKGICNGTRIKIMWEEQLVDPPIDFKTLVLLKTGRVARFKSSRPIMNMFEEPLVESSQCLYKTCFSLTSFNNKLTVRP